MPQRKKGQAAPPAPEPPRPPYVATEAEVALVQAHAERHRRRPRAPRLRLATKPAQPPQLHPDHPDRRIWTALLQEACGTTEHAFAHQLLATLAVALQRGRSTVPDEMALNGALAAMHGIAPQDEAEAMLAAQMVATHEAAMALLGRTARAEYLKQTQAYGGLAVKLLRSYTAQLEALQRLRGKISEQKVTVKHVHVHAGGQAVVGAVSTSPGGPGAPSKVEERAHAQQRQQQPCHASEPEVRRADPERQPVPGAGGARQKPV